ncbi:MAG: serine hydrolase domain-containing protein [Pseudomonadota bacterium]
MKKFFLGLLAVIAIAVLLALTVFADEIQRLRLATSLFTGAEQYENFGRVADVFPVSPMSADNPLALSGKTSIDLPSVFSFRDQKSDTQRFLQETDTAALLVLQDGEIVFENYWLTGGRETPWLSMSVAKSFVATLVGIAVQEDLIRSVDEPITDYVPWLAGSAYDQVPIRDVLQMSSGAAWNEDYGDFNSDINRLGRIFAIGGSLDKFLTQMQREFEPGTVNRYNSADTQALGALLVAATGESVSAFMQSRLWQHLRPETKATWLIDEDGMEMVFAGLNATARDYAKLGELYRNYGVAHGHQVLAKSWVIDATTATAPHLLTSADPVGDNDFGYGYQWWLLQDDGSEFSGIGVYNQFIYVNRAANAVIVKLSANSDYGVREGPDNGREAESFALFRAIAASLPTADPTIAPD